MTFDEIIDSFASSDSVPEEAIEAALDTWDECGAGFRALLHAYAVGSDLSERTERAMLAVVHVLGEMEDTASFRDLCTLAHDHGRLESALGEDGSAASYPAILISTFNGEPEPLYRIIEDPSADELARGDALLVLAYLVRTDRFSESQFYAYLAALPPRLQPEKDDFVWFGYARAVAAMGFAGLSASVEKIFARGLITPEFLSSAEFWSDLRDSQQNPDDFMIPVWTGLGPLGSAADQLWLLSETSGPGEFDAPEAIAEPVRNPLRNVGRNDPCPCGSGKKYKKCCLQAD